MITVYHGSNEAIENPLVGVGRYMYFKESVQMKAYVE